jgi:hypothetical protein
VRSLGRRRIGRAGSSPDFDVIRFESSVDGLDGVVYSGLDDGQIQEHDWAGTTTRNPQLLHGNVIPIGRSIWINAA